MAPTRDNEREPVRRRVPQQSRSRDRVRRILDVAGQLVVTDGVAALSTRSIADRADVPVASLYQYFADKESILLALVERDVADMDAQVAEDLGELDVLTVRGLVETTMRAFVKVYHRRPSFVVIWLRGRTNVAINAFCRSHNSRIAKELFEFASGAGLVDESAQLLNAELAVEVGDRLFQIAFEDDLLGDPRVIDEGVDLVSSYLERHATTEGLQGVRLR